MKVQQQKCSETRISQRKALSLTLKTKIKISRYKEITRANEKRANAV